MEYLARARRAVVVVAALLLVALAAPWVRAASPDEEADACVDQYQSGATSFTCTVCGVEAGCSSADDCYWGAIKVQPSLSGVAAGLSAGFQIYCINRGGSLLASSSSIGSQGQTMDRALGGGTRRSPGQLAVGGILEYGAYEGGSSTEGIAAPISKNVAWSSREMDLDLSGALMFGSGESVQQYGVTAHPTLRFFPGGGSPEPGTRAVFGTSLPLQLLVMTGDALDTSIIYHAGLGGIAGIVSDSGLGAGFAMDAIYASGIQLPLQLVGRWSTPFQGGALAIQPALSADAISGGSILDTLQQNVMLGYDSGSWLFGLRVFRQGDDAWVFGLGVSHATHAAELAAGTASEYQRTAQAKPGQTPQGQPPPSGPPQEALEALLLVDAAGDVTESARTRASVTEVLHTRGITPLLRTETDQVLAQTAPAVPITGLSPAQMEAARQGMRGDLVVWVTAQRVDAVNARMQIVVFGRGLRARRELVVPFEAVSRAAGESVAALFATFDVRGLPDQVTPPDPLAPPPAAPPVYPPPAPPPAVTPVPPPPVGAPAPPPPSESPSLQPQSPPPPPPSESSPPAQDGCVKDTDCKGERICENGKCVNPPKRSR